MVCYVAGGGDEGGGGQSSFAPNPVDTSSSYLSVLVINYHLKTLN